jgi:DNA-binding SARP family transcriptional activator/WD40 repeat protein
VAGIRVLGIAGIDGAADLAPRDRRVLAALVVTGGRFCPADRLAAALYGDQDPPPSWRKVVQGSITRLRSVLGAQGIESSANGYRLTLGDDAIDARRFERLLREADAYAAQGDGERAAIAYREALALYTGEPLVDLDGWEPGRAEAARLAELRLLAEERHVDALLTSGRHQDAASLAIGLVEEQPLREQRWAALALAQYRCGRQGDALRSLNRARRVLATEVGLEPSHELVELEHAILAQEPNLSAQEAASVAAGPCPYRGLRRYDVDDADEFFGRESATEECVRRLSASGFLAIVGPSGCGKSSLARAGVAATLKRSGRDVVVVTPGTHPEHALDGIAQGTALVVDQLEEVFAAAVGSEQRAAFVAQLAARVTTAPVVVTLRSDHLDSVAENADFAALVESSIYLLRPMGEADLRAAIEGPATRAGLRLEPGLVDLLVRDVIDQPGALPLLSHALAEVWARRESRVLTAASYRAVGGVQGAVGQTADLAFERLPPEGRRIARQLFLRLVTVADGEPTSQRVARRDIGIDAPHADVIDVLTRARLLTVDETTVQVAHEALARAWPRLRAWLDEDREGQRILGHLSSTAIGWEALGRDDAELYRGARLRTAEEWVATAQPTLTRSERAFLDASIAQRHEQEDDLRARADAQARVNRRLRGLLAALATVLVVAIVSAGVAVEQNNHAAHETRVAQADSREAIVQGLVGQASGLRGTRRDVAVLLALAAYRIAPRADTLGALMSAVTADSGLDRTIDVNVPSIYGGLLLPNGTTFAVMDPNEGVRLVDMRSGRELGALPPLQATTNSTGAMAVSHDGRFLALATGSLDGHYKLTVWNLATRTRRFADRELSFAPGSLAFSPDDRRIAVSGGDDGTADIRDAGTGSETYAIPGLPRPQSATFHVNTAALAFTPDGELALTSLDGPLRLIDPQTGREIRRLTGPEQVASSIVEISSDGRTLFGSGTNGISRWDLASGRLTWVQSSGGQCDSIAIAQAVNALLCAHDGRVTAYDLGSGDRRGEAFDDQGANISMQMSKDGSELIEAGLNTLTVWRLDGGSAVSRLIRSGTDAWLQEYDPDGQLIISPKTPDVPWKGPRLLDATTGVVLDPLPGVTLATGRAQPPHLLAAQFADGTAGLYDTVLHKRVRDARNQLTFTPDGSVAAGNTLIAYTDHQAQGISRDGKLVAPSLTYPSGRGEVLATTDGSRIFTFQGGRLVQRTADGRPIATVPIPDIVAAVATRDRLVVSTGDGRVRTFDAQTLQDRGDLTGTGSGAVVTQMNVSANGDRVVLVAGDGIRIVDPTSRAFIGGSIGAASADSIDNTQFDSSAGALLDADGSQLAVGTGRGIVVWNLDAATLTTAACRIAGRSLTETEWHRYIGTQIRYSALCG